MSAVLEAVGNVVEAVGDAVGDAVEFVGDTVSNVVEAALDDPIKAIAQVAAVATGNAWALPIIEGVDVLEEGGSIEDALKSAAVTYVVQQGVSYAVDSFAPAASGTSGSGTTTFFDDGSSMQFFDDGSRLITDSAGAVSSVPATDVVMPVSAVAAADAAVSLAQPSTSIAPISSGIENVFDEVLRGADSVSDAVNDLFSRTSEFLEQFYRPAESFPVLGPENAVYGDEFFGPFMPEAVGDVAPGAISPENVPVLAPEGAAVLPDDFMGPPAPEVIAPKGAYYPDTAEFVSTTLPAQPQYETMEQLLLDRGLITPEQALDAVAPVAIEAAPPDIYDMLPDSFGEQVAIDPNAPAIDPNAPAAAAPKYETMEDLLYDKGLIDDKAYRELTGVAPVVDRSVDASTLPPAVDRPLSESLIDLGKAAGEYAVEHPFQTAAVIGGGLALAGAAGGEEQPASTEAAKKTYTYGAAPPIRRTGLQELYSAASNIYGDDYVRKQLGIQAPPPPAFQSSFQPLLSGQAPGASRVGLGSLGQGFTYTPMGSPQTFDISTLTPEQIIQLQDMVNRRKQPGGG